MLASRVLITAGTPGHMYLEERQAKCLAGGTEGEGGGLPAGRGAGSGVQARRGGGREGCSGAGRARGARLRPWRGGRCKQQQGMKVLAVTPSTPGCHSPFGQGGGRGTHVMAW